MKYRRISDLRRAFETMLAQAYMSACAIVFLFFGILAAVKGDSIQVIWLVVMALGFMIFLPLIVIWFKRQLKE